MIIMVGGCACESLYMHVCVLVYVCVYIWDDLFVYTCVCCLYMLYYTAPLGAIVWNYRLSVSLPAFQ